MYAQELQSGALSLLLRTPNGRHGVGYNRYCIFALNNIIVLSYIFVTLIGIFCIICCTC